MAELRDDRHLCQQLSNSSMITNAVFLVQSLHDDLELGVLQAAVVHNSVLSVADAVAQPEV
jgi:hypothetical protein